MILLFTLLILFQIKHFLSDYPLQTSWMLRKFLPGTDFIAPLAAHCGVHAAGTFFICAYFAPNIALSMAALDFSLHFIMDRIKASPTLLGRFKALSGREYPTATEQEKKNNTLFWSCLGIDQMVHHLTHYLIIWHILHSIGYM